MRDLASSGAWSKYCRMEMDDGGVAKCKCSVSDASQCNVFLDFGGTSNVYLQDYPHTTADLLLMPSAFLSCARRPYISVCWHLDVDNVCSVWCLARKLLMILCPAVDIG